MPILTFTATGLYTTNQSELGIYPFTFSNSLNSKDNIFFCSDLSFLNFVRVRTSGLPPITPQNLNQNYLLVFVCDDVVDDNFINLYSTEILNLSITNNYLNANINSLLPNHETLCDLVSYDEVLSLCKEYKLIFRITNDPQKDKNILNLKNGDIVNNFQLIFDTLDRGPYGVKFEHIDVLSPSEFTDAEKSSVYSNTLSIFGYDGMRIFYPEEIVNTNNTMPIVCIQHGVGQEHQGYDIYASKLASYGYFVCMLQQETWAGSNSKNGNYHILGKLRHFKNNINKIKLGKFNNKINFNKITLVGHSQGGDKVYSACSEVGIDPSSGIDINNIMCLVLINPAIAFQFPAAGFRSSAETPESTFRFAADVPLLCLGSDNDDAVQAIAYDFFVNYGMDADYRNKNYKRLISFRNSLHGGPILDFNFLNYVPLLSSFDFDNRMHYTKNSKANSINYSASYVTYFLSMCLKEKIKSSSLIQNSYQITNDENNIKQSLYFIDHEKSSNIDLVIDEYNSMSPNLSYSGLDFILDTNSARDVYQSFDTFDGVLTRRAGENSGAIRVSYTGDSFIKYDSEYNLINSKYIEIYCAQILDYTEVYNNFSEDKNFCLKLIDGRGNEALMSSKLYNGGIPVHVKVDDPIALSNPQSITCPFPIRFNIEHIEQLNPELDLSDIRSIILNFGPSFGSSTGRIGIYRIQTIV
jgi:hypothetical protein